MNDLRRIILNLGGPAVGTFFLGDVLVERRWWLALWWLLLPTYVAVAYLTLSTAGSWDTYLLLLFGFLVPLTLLLVVLWSMTIIREARRVARDFSSPGLAWALGVAAGVIVVALVAEARILSFDPRIMQAATALRWSLIALAVVCGASLFVVLVELRKKEEGKRPDALVAGLVAPALGMNGARFFVQGRVGIGVAFLLTGWACIALLVAMLIFAYPDEAPDEIRSYIAVPLSAFVYAMLWAAQALDWGPARKELMSKQGGAEQQDPIARDEARSTRAAPARPLPPIVYRDRGP